MPAQIYTASSTLWILEALNAREFEMASVSECCEVKRRLPVEAQSTYTSLSSSKAVECAVLIQIVVGNGVEGTERARARRWAGRDPAFH
jgi:hypothetical protein